MSASGMIAAGAFVGALVSWWASTAAILRLTRASPARFPLAFGLATLALPVAFAALHATRKEATLVGAGVSFLAGIAVWAWVEVSFLLGYVTGPRRSGCGGSCTPARHFVHAVEAILWHELAIIALAVTSVLVAGDGVNRTGAYAVLLLWGMRTSAKLNLFLGVRNNAAHLLPPRLAYLGAFFGRRPMNPLLPASVALGATLTACLGAQAMRQAGEPFGLAEWTLLATLCALGVIEHVAMVAPGREPRPVAATCLPADGR